MSPGQVRSDKLYGVHLRAAYWLNKLDDYPSRLSEEMGLIKSSLKVCPLYLPWINCGFEEKAWCGLA
jgi:hypothetical protein